MCELFGMSASQAVTARGTLGNFRLRGGLAADNPDGWGLAWWENGVFRIAKEPLPAYSSALFEDLSETTRSNLIVAHVRKARFPPVNTMDNTHPFQRVCCGREWVFAHNGLVPDIVEMERANNDSVCQPAGETDSEYAFCHLLSYISQNIQASPATTANVSFPNVAIISELIASHGKFNFLMSDGEHLIAYGHDRLNYLEQKRSDAQGGASADNAMIATEPLPGSGSWIAFEPGELRIYRLGKLAVHKEHVNSLVCMPDMPEQGAAVMKRMDELDLPLVEDMFVALVAEGATLLACPLNIPLFGMSLSDLVDGVKLADPATYYKDVVIQADMNLTF